MKKIQLILLLFTICLSMKAGDLKISNTSGATYLVDVIEFNCSCSSAPCFTTTRYSVPSSATVIGIPNTSASHTFLFAVILVSPTSAGRSVGSIINGCTSAPNPYRQRATTTLGHRIFWNDNTTGPNNAVALDIY